MYCLVSCFHVLQRFYPSKFFDNRILLVVNNCITIHIDLYSFSTYFNVQLAMLVFFITRCDSWMAKSPDITLFESPIKPYPTPPPTDQMCVIPCFYMDIEFHFLKNIDKFVDRI